MALNFGTKPTAPAGPIPQAAPQAQPAPAGGLQIRVGRTGGATPPPAAGGFPAVGRPVPAARPMVQKDVFDGAEHVKSSFAANYVREGHYFAIPLSVKRDKTRNNEEFIAIEQRCVAVLAHGTIQQPLRVGEEYSHLIMATNDSFMPNFKQFITSISGCADEEVTKEVCLTIVGPEQPMSKRDDGSIMVMEFEAKQIVTKGGNDFTKVIYKREVPWEEVVQHFDSAEAFDRIFGQGYFAALQQASGG